MWEGTLILLFNDPACDILMLSDPNIYLFNGRTGAGILLFSTKWSYSFKKEDVDRDYHAAVQDHDYHWKISGDKIAISMLYEQPLYHL